jgi:anti-sigma regulatory factor (Ser/Thr protein kinase)
MTHAELGPVGVAAPDPARLTVDEDLGSVGRTRSAVRDVLESWRLPQLVDSVVLAVSELVTNALRHGRPPVAVVLHREVDGVAVDVHDDDPLTPPADRTAADVDAESGRGLDIIEILADRVSYEQVPDDGKVVRAVFSTPHTD